MPQNIFGTDGVRGVANADLSCDLAFRLGRAATKFLGPDICIGRDTRLSGTMLESALTAGIMAEGGRPHCCGVIPTPAVALLTVQNELDGGIVISASHNPPEFNGIKFFSRKGMKLPDAVEEEISAWVMSEEAMAADTLPTGAGVGHIIKMKDARKAYVDHAISTLDGLKLDGLVVAVDCGHGASCQTTPAALQRLGATVHAINTDYCGTDINVECGSTHLEPLRELVLRTHADIGLAHDGDADRVLFVDSEGNELLLGDILGTDNDLVYNDIEVSVEKELLNLSLNKLSKREQQIVNLRFGLNGAEEKTQKEVADLLGISQSYISRLEKKIITRLKKEIIKMV